MRLVILLFCLVVAMGCQADESLPKGDLAATAEQFFRGVYGCDGSDLKDVANPEVRMSYPIFADRLGTPTLEGLEAVQAFAAGFCRRWSNPTITIHEVIEDEDRLALVWSYAASFQSPAEETSTRSNWGGISVFHFDESGRVLLEFGEESTPGPYSRIRPNDHLPADSL